MKSLAIIGTLVRFYLRSVPSGWYRRLPFLPLPSRSYVRWRMETAYGYRPPAAGVLFRDLWQFGSWLAASEREARLRGRAT